MSLWALIFPGSYGLYRVRRVINLSACYYL